MPPEDEARKRRDQALEELRRNATDISDEEEFVQRFIQIIRRHGGQMVRQLKQEDSQTPPPRKLDNQLTAMFCDGYVESLHLLAGFFDNGVAIIFSDTDKTYWTPQQLERFLDLALDEFKVPSEDGEKPRLPPLVTTRVQ